jgi:mRNA-degrading endonuclease RelE of RelBE toxin-antitoxin system
VAAVHGWLERLYSAYESWRHQSSGGQVSELWQEVLQWYSAFDLSFAQLVQYMDDIMDISDAQLALALASTSLLRNGVRMLPMANQRLRALPPELQDHLLSIHLTRLFTQTPVLGSEHIRDMNDVYRLRIHGCRVIYHLAEQGPLILSITPEHWRTPKSEMMRTEN